MLLGARGGHCVVPRNPQMNMIRGAVLLHFSNCGESWTLSTRLYAGLTSWVIVRFWLHVGMPILLQLDDQEFPVCPQGLSEGASTEPKRWYESKRRCGTSAVADSADASKVALERFPPNLQKEITIEPRQVAKHLAVRLFSASRGQKLINI